MTIRNNRTEISLALGEAVLDIVQKGHELSRENLARGDENQSGERARRRAAFELLEGV